MFENYRVIAVTPAGRKKYLEILLPYIFKNKGIIDEYHLWVNTSVESDIQYIKNLQAKFPDFIKLKWSNLEPNGSLTVYQFYKYCIDLQTIYIKIDDDICFIEENAIEELLRFRVVHSQYFLIYANTINNVICSHIHQRMGMPTLDKGVCTYNPFCDLGWRSGNIASNIHSTFFSSLRECTLEFYKYKQWVLHEFERTSINFVCWFGTDFAEFEGKVCSEEHHKDDEQWLSVHKPRALNRFNCICGAALVVHFAYYTQRDYLESQTSILQNYKKLSETIVDSEKMINKFTTHPKITPLTKEIHQPFWSVVIPTYNCADYLAETLKSVLEQDPGSEQMQIEVIDDCSTKDNPELVVKEIGKGRVSFFRQPQNVGAMLNFNTCIQRAQGQWVHILHGDDTVLPGFYRRFREAIEKEPTIGAVYCRHIYMNENGHWSFLSQLERETSGILSDSLERLVVYNRIMTPSIVVKRNVYEQIGGFHLELFHCGDWDMWKRVAATCPVWYEPQPLACYRQHSNSDTSRLIRTGANIADGRKSIAISESYLPKTIATEFSNLAREHHAKYAFNTAHRLFTMGDTVAAIAQIREGIKCSYSPKAIKSMLELLSEIANNSNQFELLPINALDQFLAEFQFIVQLGRWADEYRKNPQHQPALLGLQQARREVVQKYLNLLPTQLESVYSGEVGKVHQILLDSQINNEHSIDETQILVDGCQYLEDYKAINYLLAAMLYYRADELSLPCNLTDIPNWLLGVYLKFVFQSSPLFKEVGQVEKYYHYMRQWIDHIHTHIYSKPDSRLWQDVAVFFARNVNLIPLYFSQENLMEIYSKRADIIEFGLKLFDHQIDYDFRERVKNRNKIRVGILNNNFNPQTETFSTIPAFEHLDRHEFEIILYAIHTNGHPLESYCQSRADKLVKLPNDLAPQVQTIRDDDLDIILIGTNVSAVTNSITLLAMHRLARVQLTCFSSPVTTGIRNIDYYISGNLTEAAQEAQNQYREQLIALDGTGYCFNYWIQPEPTAKPTRQSLGIEEKSVVFISGANFYKIIPELRETWSKIIALVPNSVLVLYPFSPSWSSSYAADAFESSMKSTFAKHGIDENRIVILDMLPNRSDVKEHLKLADIYLDSYPYSGSHSTLDSLEVGLPTIVMDGLSLRSRQGAALLRELQIFDLIADSEEIYIQLAIALGTKPDLRKQKSAQIKKAMQANPSFLDSRAYSAQMGQIFQKLFCKYQAERLTENFNLRENNLIIFPDWNQPEDLLYQDVASAIATLMNCPERNQTTLLIDRANLTEDEATLFVSGVVMNLVMEEDLDVADELEISLVGQLSEIQWKALLPQIQARIVLENENKEAIAQVKAETLPCYLNLASNLN